MQTLKGCTNKLILSLQCDIDLDCTECDIKDNGDACNGNIIIPLFICDSIEQKIKVDSQNFLKCNGNYFEKESCETDQNYDSDNNRCITLSANRRKRSEAGSARAGDVCSFNTDCQSGMFCGNGVCTCLSDFVSIAGYCWPKANPGESGCIEDRQCEAVWPGARCSSTGICECPDETVPAKSRDGTLCITSGIPPACPLPETNTGLPNPATVLANPSTHPLERDTYMPVLCTSTSNEVHNSNGGDGSTWCIYPDGDHDIYIADLYNCVPHPQVSNVIFPEYADSVDGICCHSRAFVCIQPLEVGNTPSVPRWWYNSVTGTCSQFLWDPTMTENVSPNNFRTIEHCESFCRDTCRRGANQFADSKWAMIEDTRVQNCAHNPAGCASEYQCTVIGSHQTCCPTVSHICSPYGGRVLHSKPDVSSDRGVLIAGGRPSTRYFYDSDQGRCLNFLYNGLGNYNNFLTKQDCETFCSKLVCEFGNPLRIGEDWQRCTSNSDCPSSHLCDQQHRVCCPTPQTICTQPKRLGDCTNSVRRYWYNAQTRQCEIFQYTGCQGNDNNFDSLLACQTKCKNVVQEPKCQQGRAYKDLNGNFVHCSGSKGTGRVCPANYHCFFDGTSYGCCPTKAYTCSLNADKGVQCGSGRSYRYFFNSNKQTCESLQYEGCDGNSNNFQTAEECQEYCGIGGCPNGGQPLRDIASNQLMQCSDAAKCPHTHDCVTVTVNGNVAQRCCPSKIFICSQPPQQGNHCSKMAITRYYFNIVTKECAKFSFNGCNGNLNNFVSFEQCNNFCASAGCAAGETTYKDVSSKKVVECNNLLVNSCPPDYTCRYDALGARHVCCGSTHMDVCPVGEKAFINPLDESVRECAINVPGSCPADFLCRFSPSKNRYFCCASKNGNVCPDGKALYRGSKLLLPMRCTMHSSVNTCTDGFSCQSRTKNVLQGYCCSTQNVCKNDAEFLIDEKTKMPRICTLGAFIACPVGYRCHKSSASSQHGFCCKGEVNALIEGCPPGEYAYVIKGNIEHCDPFKRENKGCPAGYSCQFSIAFQRYQCCGKEPIEEEEITEQVFGCPSSQIALISPETRSVVPCTSSTASCPLGYFCQFSEKNKQFQCCAHKSGCPGESVAFVDISGSPKECSPRITHCPIGYSCQRTKSSKYFCCTLRNETIDNEPITSASISNSLIRKVLKGSKRHRYEDLKCLPSQVIVNGECRCCCVSMQWFRERGIIGSPCSVSTQCLFGSYCVDMICRCPKGTREIDEVCIRVEQKDKEDEADDTNICTEHQVMVNGKCFKIMKIGERCFENEQCFNGSKCIGNLCKCPPNTAGYNNRCLANLCGAEKSRSPYLTKGSLAVICTATKCPGNSKCLFSKMVKDYICCVTKQSNQKSTKQTSSSSVPKASSVITASTTARCPGGHAPLIFPATNQPLQCIPPKQQCPKNYTCTNHMCCPSGLRNHKKNSTLKCPRHLVKVFFTKDGRRFSRCERSCPRNQKLTKGVCQPVAKTSLQQLDDPNTPLNQWINLSPTSPKTTLVATITTAPAVTRARSKTETNVVSVAIASEVATVEVLSSTATTPYTSQKI